MWDWYEVYKNYDLLNEAFQEGNPIFIPKRSMKIKNKLLKNRYSKRCKDKPKPRYHKLWCSIRNKKQRNKRRLDKHGTKA